MSDDSIEDHYTLSPPQEGFPMVLMNTNTAKEVPGRSKKPGRSARRRNAKSRAIATEYAKIMIHNNNEQEVNTSDLLSTNNDREELWPSVLAARRELSSNVIDGQQQTFLLSTHDQLQLKKQLGYIPGNALRVVARRPYLSENPTLSAESTYNFYGGEPTVLQLYPLAKRDFYAGGKSDGRKYKSRQRGSTAEDRRRDWRTPDGGVMEPFPTMYWITCPKLRVRISQLEEDGMLQTMEQRLAADPEALQRMEEAHVEYSRDRWLLLTESDRIEVTTRGWDKSLNRSGIAGILRHPQSIKCLHCHVAHYLADPLRSKNIVGQWVMEAILPHEHSI
mmetsp:Transcript_19023/g.27031  ORF Transcript_19023/g.27031 Transcript_19023/m.27031 type:complete len:334 (-) Transcript_19023:21-1022(-)